MQSLMSQFQSIIKEKEKSEGSCRLDVTIQGQEIEVQKKRYIQIEELQSCITRAVSLRRLVQPGSFSDRCRFALRKCCIRLDNSTSGSFRFDYGSWFGVLYHANYGCTLEIGGIFKNVELLSASSNSSAIFQPIIFTFIKLHFICYHNKIVL